MQFSFSTGNEHHPSGLGAWQGSLTGHGTLMVSWKRAGHESSFGPFQLENEENQRIWGLINRMNIPALSSSTRMGIPDEVICTFTIHFDEEPHSTWMWMEDARKIASVDRLVTEIDRLIKQYTGQTSR